MNFLMLLASLLIRRVAPRDSRAEWSFSLARSFAVTLLVGLGRAPGSKAVLLGCVILGWNEGSAQRRHRSAVNL
jgi:hypothetical protein